jgi:hypothetical protein
MSAENRVFTEAPSNQRGPNEMKRFLKKSEFKREYFWTLQVS